MSTKKLIRWGGLAVILAGLGSIVIWVLDLAIGEQRSITTDSIGFVIMLFFVFGTMGIYACQVNESGLTGFWGFLLVTISNCTLIGQTWLTETEELASLISNLDMLGGLTGVLGYTLLGIGSLKAGILPKWAVWLWIIGYLISFVMMLVYVMGVEVAYDISRFAVVIWGIGWTGVGVRLIFLPSETISTQANA
ncbi:MAG: hypothetical protein PVG14_19345 [Anaerolineales bacterium]|jgi:hypothetical protein